MQCSTASVFLAASLLVGCAFSDGSNWGTADIDFTSSFDADGREVDPGVYRTSKNLKIQLTSVDVSYGAVTLGMSEDSVAAFDPANPPAGFSNCHNGHCHADAGGIVEYADIPLGGTSSFSLIREVPESIALFENSTPISLCENDCDLERGVVTSVAVRVASARIVGVVLDEDGNDVPFDATLLIDESKQIVTDVAVGQDRAGTFEFDVRAVVSAKILDGLSVDASGVQANNFSENFIDSLTLILGKNP